MYSIALYSNDLLQNTYYIGSVYLSLPKPKYYIYPL